MHSPTPYAELNTVLEHFVSALRDVLRDELAGAYLQGSFAVGDFDQHSDADFLIVVRDELGNGEVEQLQRLHYEVFDLPAEWAKHLEGSYFPLAVLRNPDLAGTPLWYLDHGSNSLERSTHCNTSYARMLHDLTVGHPGSKRAGAEWAKTVLDPQWQNLIDRAWATRPNPAVSARQPAGASEFERSLEFIETCVRAAIDQIKRL